MKPVTVKLFFLFLYAMSYASTAAAMENINVFVSIAPQKYFVRQIGGDYVDVQVMVQPGANPATYEPKPRQMTGLSHSDIYFAVGVPFEKAWLNKFAAANPKMKVVHTDSDIEKIPMTPHQHHDEDNQAEADGTDHDGLDPHVWLSPPLVKIQAGTIFNALRKIDPIHGNEYETNYHKFISVIDQLDTRLKHIFAEKEGTQFMVFHPAWGYFAHAYGLEQIPIEIEGKNPKPAQLKMLIESAREKGIKTVFVQPQFSTKSAELIAGGIGGRVLFADPLVEDWPMNLWRVAETFKDALK